MWIPGRRRVCPRRVLATGAEPPARAGRKLKISVVLDPTDEAEVSAVGQDVVDTHFANIARRRGGPARPPRDTQHLRRWARFEGIWADLGNI